MNRIVRLAEYVLELAERTGSEGHIREAKRLLKQAQDGEKAKRIAAAIDPRERMTLTRALIGFVRSRGTPDER